MVVAVLLAYDFISDKMRNEKDSVMTTKLGEVFNLALQKLNLLRKHTNEITNKTDLNQKTVQFGVNQLSLLELINPNRMI
jgi:hypothetical protein